jgi:hypothetical protein
MRLVVVPDETARRLTAEDPSAVEVPVLRQMEDLIVKLMPAVPRVPDAGWTEQARRNAQLREHFMSEVRLLDAAQVAELSGSASSNPRATASRWSSSGRIFGVPVGAQVLYPAFQFDDFGQPRTAVAQVLEVLKGLNLSVWATALWWGTAHEILDWRTPAEVLPGVPSAVLTAAQTDARTLGR